MIRPDNNLALFIGHLIKPTPTHSHLYRCLVLPTLYYCSSVWDLHVKYLINKLDSVQRLAVKMVTKQWSFFSTHMLSTHPLNLCPLQERQWKQKAIVCAKILRGCSIIPPFHFTPHPHPSQRLHHSFPLFTPIARTSVHQSSFFISSTLIWNSLPEHVIVSLLFLHLRIDLSHFQFLSLILSFVLCSYSFFSPLCFSGRLCISIELPLPNPNSYSALH